MTTTPTRRFRSPRRAFTLIEVLIVLGIVLALSAIIGVAVFQRGDDAKIKLAQTDLNNIKSALRLFRLDYDRYPTEDEGIEVLWNRDALDVEDEELEERWSAYLETPLPEDRWGNAWVYTDESENGQEYDLSSNGPDGDPDTEDDITSWAGAAGADDEGFGDDLLPPGPDGP